MSDQDLTARLDGLNTDQLKRLIDAAEDRIDQADILADAETVAPAVQACRAAYLAHPEDARSIQETMDYVTRRIEHARQSQHQLTNV
jgi:phosphoribosylaminoimidazole carboxylase (NCAIR synthetase)